MSIDHHNKPSKSTQQDIAAKKITSEIRQQIGISALACKDSISNLSRKHSTSRKFVYTQKDKVSTALKDVFCEKKKNSEVLFSIPVTKEWLKQVVLSLTLTCHSSYGGVIEFFRDILDQNICKGSIFNIMQHVLAEAQRINTRQDLSSIQVGAHDEIFQGGTPVLVGCDVKSTYTYLLKQVEHRDTTSWGVHLLELSDQGMSLDYSIADGGKGLRSGQKEAWPDVPCRGDVFHPLYDIGKVVTFLQNRAIATKEVVEQLEIKMTKAKKKNQGAKYSKRLSCAKKEAELALKLKDDVLTLSEWLKKDIFSVVGSEFSARKELLEFVINELKSREALCLHRIRSIRRLFEIQGEDLLRFVGDIDGKIKKLAAKYSVDSYWIHQLFELQSFSYEKKCFWELHTKLYAKIGRKLYRIQEEIQDIIQETVRASSIVENVNSRLRNYFFLRKTVGNGYLELLQFYLNHRRFMRSSVPERIGKSPKELLTKESHCHWLELLGHKMFKKAGLEDNACARMRNAA